MNYNILAKFTYNGKTYVYYVLPDKPQNLLYGYIDNGEIKPVVDVSAFKIMEELSNRIFVSTNPNDHVKLTKIKFKSKLFQIIYDKKSRLKFFYEIKDNVFYMPSKEDQDDLSRVYNKTVFNLSNGLGNEDKNRKANKVLKALKIFDISGAIVVVIMAGSLIFNNFIKPNVPVQSEQTTTQTVTVVEPTATPKIDFSLEKLTDALNQNPNLSEEEKAYIFDQFDILIENPDYVDMNLTIQKLLTLTIEYSNEIVLGVGAVYYPGENKIVVYQTNSLRSCDKMKISHELFHFLSNAYGSLGISITEGMTELLSAEKNASMETAYYEQCEYVRMLAEIIGPEPLKAFYLSGNIECIVKALTKIILDDDAAYYFLSSLDDALTYEEDYSFGWQNSDFDTTDLSKEELLSAIETNKKFIGYTLDNYFYAVKGYHMQEDLIMRIYYNYLFSDEPANIYTIDSDGNEVLLEFPYIDINKGYFLKSYMEKYHSGEVGTGKYIGEGENKKFVEYTYIIDDDNRILTLSENHPGAYYFKGTNLSEEVKKVN